MKITEVQSWLDDLFSLFKGFFYLFFVIELNFAPAAALQSNIEQFVRFSWNNWSFSHLSALKRDTLYI